MKRIAVLGAVIFIVSSVALADENPGEVRRFYFTWQLYGYYNDNNFLLIAPLGNTGLNSNFFIDNTTDTDSKNHFLNNYFEFLRLLANLNQMIFGPSEEQRQREREREYNRIFYDVWDYQIERDRFYERLHQGNNQ